MDYIPQFFSTVPIQELTNFPVSNQRFGDADQQVNFFPTVVNQAWCLIPETPEHEK